MPDEKVTASQIADPADVFLTAAEEHASDERQFVLPGSGRWSCEDIPLLVAAVRAGLDLHKPEGYHWQSIPCEQHTGPGWLPGCPDCKTIEHVRCWQSGCPDEWPCPTYTAITEALTGRAGTDGN